MLAFACPMLILLGSLCAGGPTLGAQNQTIVHITVETLGDFGPMAVPNAAVTSLDEAGDRRRPYLPTQTGLHPCRRAMVSTR
jgi:hypothetical protein